jgi:amidase
MSDSTSRRSFLERAAAVGAALALPSLPAGAQPSVREHASAWREDATRAAADDRTIPMLQAAMARGELTARTLTEQCLARISASDASGPAIRAVIETNPDALAIADRLDAERAAGRTRGPLHGIPVLVKDNIDTGDRMQTTAGSLALEGARAPRDAYIIERLRAAGAIVLGKTNLSEWANYRSTHSSSGWSGRGGQTRNPYVLDRSPCGSSSGTGAAIAAGYAPVGIGSETDGSIICPSSMQSLVGIKPTVGLWSRSGIIPISASQDTAGPMARTVTDAAVLLGALTGADPRDDATKASAGHTSADYAAHLDAGALKGTRIGVARNLAGFDARVDRAFDDALAALTHAGATLVEIKLTTANTYGDAESEVLQYEFKDGLAKYFAAFGPTARAKTLGDLIAFNTKDATRSMPWFGQELFEMSWKKGPLTDPTYKKARAACLAATRTRGLDVALNGKTLDAIVAPSNGPAWVIDHVNGDHFGGGDTSFAAVSGYPSITVPMGFVHELPIGLSFIGRAWSEAQLIALAYAFEQATNARRAPKFIPSLG